MSVEQAPNAEGDRRGDRCSCDGEKTGENGKRQGDGIRLSDIAFVPWTVERIGRELNLVIVNQIVDIVSVQAGTSNSSRSSPHCLCAPKFLNGR
jgi:hypothetical protein